MKVSKIIPGPAARLYGALIDPEALAAWLPPPGMRGEVRGFEPGVGGGYEMTLTYLGEGRGKTTADSDTVRVRFVELIPDRRVVTAARFVSDDAAFTGEMSMRWDFEAVDGATQVSVTVEGAPSGISEADHRTGIEGSLDNLARYGRGPTAPL